MDPTGGDPDSFLVVATYLDLAFRFRVGVRGT